MSLIIRDTSLITRAREAGSIAMNVGFFLAGCFALGCAAGLALLLIFIHMTPIMMALTQEQIIQILLGLVAILFLWAAFEIIQHRRTRR